VITTVRLVIDREEKVLLLKRTKRNAGGYGMIGGKVETTESLKTALIRETKEEVDIDLDPDHLELVHVLNRFKRKYQDYEVIFFFKYNLPIQELSIKETNKFKGTEWFPYEFLPFTLSKSARQGLIQMKKGHIFSELFV
jgi:8-oxo-dGTP diphosphatase